MSIKPMKVFIKDTGETKYLSIVDAVEFNERVHAFVGNSCDIGKNIIFDDVKKAYVCSHQIFVRWRKLINAYQALDFRIVELCEEHNPDEVYKVVHEAGDDVNFFDRPAAVNQALDAAFGNQY